MTSTGGCPVRKPSVVSLNVYDLHGAATGNAVLARAGFAGGAFHAGVEVFFLEWSFGYLERGTGVVPVVPGKSCLGTLKQKVMLGPAQLHDVEAFIRLLEGLVFSAEWDGAEYLEARRDRNCCHFSQHLCDLLGVGSRVPSWVNNLARSLGGSQALDGGVARGRGRPGGDGEDDDDDEGECTAGSSPTTVIRRRPPNRRGSGLIAMSNAAAFDAACDSASRSPGPGRGLAPEDDRGARLEVPRGPAGRGRSAAARGLILGIAPTSNGDSAELSPDPDGGSAAARLPFFRGGPEDESGGPDAEMQRVQKHLASMMRKGREPASLVDDLRKYPHTWFDVGADAGDEEQLGGRGKADEGGSQNSDDSLSSSRSRSSDDGRSASGSSSSGSRSSSAQSGGPSAATRRGVDRRRRRRKVRIAEDAVRHKSDTTVGSRSKKAASTNDRAHDGAARDGRATRATSRVSRATVRASKAVAAGGLNLLSWFRGDSRSEEQLAPLAKASMNRLKLAEKMMRDKYRAYLEERLEDLEHVPKIPDRSGVIFAQRADGKGHDDSAAAAPASGLAGRLWPRGRGVPIGDAAVSAVTGGSSRSPPPSSRRHQRFDDRGRFQSFEDGPLRLSEDAARVILHVDADDADGAEERTVASRCERLKLATEADAAMKRLLEASGERDKLDFGAQPWRSSSPGEELLAAESPQQATCFASVPPLSPLDHANHYVRHVASSFDADLYSAANRDAARRLRAETPEVGPLPGSRDPRAGAQVGPPRGRPDDRGAAAGPSVRSGGGGEGGRASTGSSAAHGKPAASSVHGLASPKATFCAVDDQGVVSSASDILHRTMGVAALSPGATARVHIGGRREGIIDHRGGWSNPPSGPGSPVVAAAIDGLSPSYQTLLLQRAGR